MKKKLHKLTFKPDYKFFLAGISSSENDYRLSWAINNALKLNLQKSNDLEVITKKHKVPQKFPVYKYIDENSGRQYNLISNKTENGYLISEFRQFDYFFQIYGEIEMKYELMFNTIKKMDNVLAIFKIDPQILKSKQHLIF